MRYEDWTSAGGEAGATLRSGDRRYIAVWRPALHCGQETGVTLRSGDQRYIAAIPQSFGHWIRSGCCLELDSPLFNLNKQY